MKDINSVTLIGRVTHDVGDRDFSYLSNGSAKLKISIAVNDTKKDGDSYTDDPSFIDVEYLGKGAEAIKPYISKGSQVVVAGSLKQDRWEKDGQKHSRLYVKASYVQLVGGRKSNEGNATFTPVESAIPSGYQDSDIPF